MKDLRTRLGLGTVLVTAIVLLFWLDRGAAGPWITVGIFSLLALAAQWECCAMLSAGGLQPSLFFSLGLGIVSLAAAAFDWPLEQALVLPLALYLVMEVLGRSPQNAARRLGGTLVAWMVVPVMLSSAVNIRVGEDQGWAWLIFLIAVCKAGDSAGYLVGTAFGRHKLIPEVSPNKSWEGAFASMGGSLLAGWIVAMTAFPEGAAPSTALWLGAAVVTNVGAQFGDLAESLIKRAGGVKDSSVAIPAFGGAFDLVDSFLLASPALANFLRFA
jgi:phosphatidate cytidylyltransferase